MAPGRRETEIGTHVEGRNRGTIGLCLLGSYGASADNPVKKNFTPAQASALKRLIGEIEGRAAFRKVSGHKDYAAKGGPGVSGGRRCCHEMNETFEQTLRFAIALHISI